jgi:hypothetical protein
MVSAEFGAGVNLKGILSNENGGSRIFAEGAGMQGTTTVTSS